ncbi:MAG TPA: DUF3152 domain-containing protein [Actinoplanes sp.]
MTVWKGRAAPLRGWVVATGLIAVLLTGCADPAATAAPAPPVRPTPVRLTPTPTSPAPPSARPVGITYPAAGSGAWRIAAAEPTPERGTGTLLRYRVSVERDIGGLDADSVAATVRETLSDRRGWTADDSVWFRRVGPGQRHDFTVYLATPNTRDRLCGRGPDGYTSCRNGDRVVLNVARWVKGIPGYRFRIDDYRQYMINHEVGHRLGYGHELCPGAGRPAPVMQQQTLGLHGCSPNPWPYRNGDRYAGRSGVYGDPVPPPDRGRRPGR